MSLNRQKFVTVPIQNTCEMRTIYQAFFNLLYPRLCLACEVPVAHGEKHICINCMATLPSSQLEAPFTRGVLTKKLYATLPFKYAFSLYYFSKKARVQRLLHNLKYRHQTDALFYLGRYLGYLMQKQGYDGYFDFIVPVPLHPSKLKARGYNQSALFGQGIGQVLEVPLRQDVLVRHIATGTQTTRNRQQRRRNVAGAFGLPKEKMADVSCKKILLIDDLITTGATIAACANPLFQAFPKSVSIATLAVA